MAAANGQLDTVKYLISEGAVIDKQNKDGEHSIALGFRGSGHAHVVDFLLQDTSQVI